MLTAHSNRSAKEDRGSCKESYKPECGKDWDLVRGRRRESRATLATGSAIFTLNHSAEGPVLQLVLHAATMHCVEIRIYYDIKTLSLAVVQKLGLVNSTLSLGNTAYMSLLRKPLKNTSPSVPDPAGLRLSTENLR